MIKRLLQRVSVIITLMLALAVSVTQAQPPGTCPALVELALSELADNCDDLGRNNACYGYNLVDSTFDTEVEPDFFSDPADRAEMTALASLRTAPLSLDDEHWGIAVMNVQANVPNTIPGQAVTFILMGDAEIENAVDPADATVPGEAVDITLSLEAVLRSQPTRNSNAVDIAADLLTLPADALDNSGDWLRVAYEGRTAWVMTTEVETEAATWESLPNISPESRSPMQAFYFSTGIGAPTCNDAPDVITIQGREDMFVDLTVNGADVRIGSTIHLKQTGPDSFSMTVGEGTLEVLDTGVVVEGGESIDATTDENGNITTWDDPRPATPEEIALDAAVQGVLIAALDTGPQTGETVHVVARGETFYGIAQRYETSITAILEANDLPNANTLLVGQRLIIPNVGSGFVPLPTTIPATTEEPTLADCTGLTPTSPLDGLAFGTNIFYWDGISAATSYRVIVTNQSEPGSATFATAGTETSVTGDLTYENIGYGFDFAWQVQALENGEVICTSPQINMQRASAPVPPPPNAPPAFTATFVGCDPDFEYLVDYANAAATDLVTMTWVDGANGQPGSQEKTEPSGQFGVFANESGLVNVQVFTSSGDSVTLGTLVCP